MIIHRLTYIKQDMYSMLTHSSFQLFYGWIMFKKAQPIVSVRSHCVLKVTTTRDVTRLKFFDLTSLCMSIVDDDYTSIQQTSKCETLVKNTTQHIHLFLTHLLIGLEPAYIYTRFFYIPATVQRTPLPLVWSSFSDECFFQQNETMVWQVWVNCSAGNVALS